MSATPTSKTLPNSSSASVIALHLQVPYVLGYEQWPHGADWLHEAVAESFIPLLNVFHRLLEQDIAPRVTLAISPLLCEMLTDLAFADAFESYLEERIAVAGESAKSFARFDQEEFRDLALFWQRFYTETARDFEDKYARDIVGAWRKLQDDAQLEIIACPATDADLSRRNAAAIGAQVRLGVETHKKHFGRAPSGLWLTGATPNAEIAPVLAENNIAYTLGATPLPQSYADEEYFLDDRRHFPGALRLWRRTGKNASCAQKQPYEPGRVAEVCQAQADEFLQFARSRENAETTPCALEASLPGKSWFEQAQWLQRVLRKSETKNSETKNSEKKNEVAASGMKPQLPAAPAAAPLWLEEEITACESAMSHLAAKFATTRNPKLKEILEQCGRELLLVQSGDWPRLLAHDSTREYADLRFAEHANTFEELARMAEEVGSGGLLTEGDRDYLQAVRDRDRPFQNLELRF